MTISSQEILATARSFNRTKFQHQGRLPGVGLDCVGLPVCTLRKHAIEVVDNVSYGRVPEPTLLREYLDKNFTRTSELRIGGLGLFWIVKKEMEVHVAFFAGSSLIHCLEQHGVCEHNYSENWKKRFVQAYAIPGVE